MKIIFFFVGIIIVGVTIEMIEAYIKKNDLEAKYPLFGMLRVIVQIILAIMIFSFLIYMAYKKFFETWSIDNYQHLFILMISIGAIFLIYDWIKTKKVKDNEAD